MTTAKAPTSGRAATKPMERMKRASYRDAVKWIAYNDEAGTDEPGNPDAERNASEYVTSALIADIFGITPERVGRDVIRERRKIDAAGG